MVICSKCGVSNPLGRVFCGSCGARLDLRNMSRDSAPLQHHGGPDMSGVLTWSLRIGGVVVLLIVILVVLALLPQTSTIGLPPSKAGPAEVRAFVSATARLPRGQTLGRRITEADLNGHFAESASRRMAVKSCSVDITEGRIRVRMVWQMGALELFSWKVNPNASCEVTFVPVGNRLRVVSAKRGLLPLVGPLRARALVPLYAHVKKLEEWRQVTGVLDEVQAHDDALDVTVKR